MQLTGNSTDTEPTSSPTTMPTKAKYISSTRSIRNLTDQRLAISMSRITKTKNENGKVDIQNENIDHVSCGIQRTQRSYADFEAGRPNEDNNSPTIMTFIVKCIFTGVERTLPGGPPSDALQKEHTKR